MPTTFKPQFLNKNTKQLISLLNHNVTINYDKIMFVFNGISNNSFSIGTYKIRLCPNKQTNDQQITYKLKQFDQGHKANPLWTIILKYSLEEWDNLFTYSKENELLLDIMYFDSNKILFEYKNILRCSITMNQSYEYTLNKGHFPGMNSILFKNGAIKVLKKQTEVIILIRLLESGFYYTSDYLHQ